jgi:hypothetical protein
MYTNGFGYIKRMFDHKGNGRTIHFREQKNKALLKPGMNLNIETFHGTSLQGFGYHQKLFSYINSATPKIICVINSE